MQTREWLSVSVSLCESELTLNARQLREIIIDRMIWILMSSNALFYVMNVFYLRISILVEKNIRQYIDDEREI